MSATGIEDTCYNAQQSPCETDFIRHYSCIYVSPIYEDRKGSTMSRTQPVEERSGVQNRIIDGGMKEDEKDLEIQRLKAELQRQRLREIEEERYTIADKFIDRINTISRPSDHETQHFKDSQIGGSTSYRVADRSADGSLNRQESSRGSEGLKFKTPMKNLAPNGFLKIMKEKIGADRRQIGADRMQNGEAFSAVPDIDKSVQAAAPCQQTISSLLATMQGSLENLCNSFKTCDSRESDSSKIISGAIEDELFILRKTRCKLVEMFQTSGYQSFCHKNGKGSLDFEKLSDVDDVVGEMVHPLSKNVLDSSSIGNDRKLENLKSRMQVVVQESSAIMSEKFALTTRAQEMSKEVEIQRHQIEELLRINTELLNFGQAKEDQVILLNTDMHSLRKQIEEMWEENRRLSLELAGQHNALKICKNKESALRKEHDTLKLKLTNTEYELTHREEELERLAYNLGVAVEKDMLVSDKYEYNDNSLRYAAKNKRRDGNQISQTRIFIDEMEEKLFLMETDVLKAIKEIRAV